MSDTDNLEALRASLASLEPGPVADDSKIDTLLAKCWDQFSGSDSEGMEGYKLNVRTEELRWDPPKLSFRIERHGGTVKGSSRAEIHEWQIDVDEMSASCGVVGHRQLDPRAPPLNVTPLVREVAALICSGQPDPRFKRQSESDVRVLIGKILPEEVAVAKQTLAGRRKRFWAALDEELQRQGWQAAGRGRYRKKEDE